MNCRIGDRGYFFVLWLLLSVINSPAQVLKLVELETALPIAHVAVYSSKFEKVFFSDQHGCIALREYQELIGSALIAHHVSYERDTLCLRPITTDTLVWSIKSREIILSPVVVKPTSNKELISMIARKHYEFLQQNFLAKVKVSQKVFQGEKPISCYSSYALYNQWAKLVTKTWDWSPVVFQGLIHQHLSLCKTFNSEIEENIFGYFSTVLIWEIYSRLVNSGPLNPANIGKFRIEEIEVPNVYHHGYSIMPKHRIKDIEFSDFRIYLDVDGSLVRAELSDVRVLKDPRYLGIERERLRKMERNSISIDYLHAAGHLAISQVKMDTHFINGYREELAVEFVELPVKQNWNLNGQDAKKVMNAITTKELNPKVRNRLGMDKLGECKPFCADPVMSVHLRPIEGYRQTDPATYSYLLGLDDYIESLENYWRYGWLE
jgi:hypothetical protein